MCACGHPKSGPIRGCPAYGQRRPGDMDSSHAPAVARLRDARASSCETHAPAVARRTIRGMECFHSCCTSHTRTSVSVKSSPLSAELAASCWSSSPIRGATDSACLAYADIRQHRFRKRLFARRTRRIVEQAARQQAARVVPQQTHASRTGCSTTDARASDSRYEMLALMLHITHAQNSPNPAGACA